MNIKDAEAHWPAQPCKMADHGKVLTLDGSYSGPPTGPAGMPCLSLPFPLPHTVDN